MSDEKLEETPLNRDGGFNYNAYFGESKTKTYAQKTVVGEVSKQLFWMADNMLICILVATLWLYLSWTVVDKNLVHSFSIFWWYLANTYAVYRL